MKTFLITNTDFGDKPITCVMDGVDIIDAVRKSSDKYKFNISSIIEVTLLQDLPNKK